MPRAGAPLTDGAAGFTVTITYTQSRTIVRSAAWKSVHGFDLAADAPPAAGKPQKLRLDPSITLDEAFATILHSCLHHLLESLPAAEDGRDPRGFISFASRCAAFDRPWI